MAVMQTSGVTTLISDSGVTRYRVNTEESVSYTHLLHQEFGGLLLYFRQVQFFLFQ